MTSRIERCLIPLIVSAVVLWTLGSISKRVRAESDLHHLAESKVSPRAFYGRRLEPRAVVLEGAGQSEDSAFAAMTKALPAKPPMLSMTYVDLRDDLPAYFAKLSGELGKYQQLIVPQIGLSMNQGQAEKHYEAAVAEGLEDARLGQLCAGLKSLGRPVFLRIGYEFNGSWNGYQPVAYVAAFRRVVTALRGCRLQDVAVVWNWSPQAELDAERAHPSSNNDSSRYMAYYPGDDWVDWWAINIFSAESMKSSATTSFLADAAVHKFPVMIAESTPYGHKVAEGQAAIEDWFAPFFGLIRSSPGIKAFCYIDWDWSRFPQWATWGDARVERNVLVLKFYREQLALPLYAGAGGRQATLSLLGTN